MDYIIVDLTYIIPILLSHWDMNYNQGTILTIQQKFSINTIQIIICKVSTYIL